MEDRTPLQRTLEALTKEVGIGDDMDPDADAGNTEMSSTAP
eukprot:COSAG06_NODE_64318_length_260_cov_0.403727_1_plen_40_part_10